MVGDFTLTWKRVSNMRKTDAGIKSVSKFRGGKVDAGATDRSCPST